MLLKLKINPESFLQDKLKAISLPQRSMIEEAPYAKNETPKNQRQYSPRSKEFFDILALLNKEYPKVFPLKGPRPSLKKGILHEVAEAIQSQMDISKNRIRIFMEWYTRSSLYWKYHKNGVPRYNLDYQIVGYVTEKEDSATKAAIEVSHLRKKERVKCI